MPVSAAPPDVRPEELAYWDTHARARGTADNIWKRQHLASYVLAQHPAQARVLEIGAGQATVAMAVTLVVNGHLTYMGTDVSRVFCDYVRQRWHLPMTQTDVRHLPGAEGAYDMLWAFDSLEHVRPEDRLEGYREMHRVLAPQGLILLNIPLSASHHQEAFDHGFDEQDLAALARETRTRIRTAEQYDVAAYDPPTRYQFVVLAR